MHDAPGDANLLSWKNEAEKDSVSKSSLLWPIYLRDRHNHPVSNHPAEEGYKYPTKYFPRSVISKVLGGSLRNKDVKVGKNTRWPYHCKWYKCMKGDWNPHQPEYPGIDGADLTFDDVPVIPSGFSSCNKGPIPVFCGRGPSKWQYVGHYEMVYRNDYMTETERNHPSIKTIAKFWISELAENLKSGGAGWATKTIEGHDIENPRSMDLDQLKKMLQERYDKVDFACTRFTWSSSSTTTIYIAYYTAKRRKNHALKIEN